MERIVRRTDELQEEADNVAQHEELCRPTVLDDGELLAFDGVDGVCESHVQGCGEEGWSEKQEQCLDGVGGECGMSALAAGDGAGGVADEFDCEAVRVSNAPRRRARAVGRS